MYDTILSLVPSLAPVRQVTLDAHVARAEAAHGTLLDLIDEWGAVVEAVSRMPVQQLRPKLVPEAFNLVGRAVRLAVELRDRFDHPVSIDVRSTIRGSYSAKEDGAFTAAMQTLDRDVTRYATSVAHARHQAFQLRTLLDELEAMPAVYSDRFVVPEPIPGAIPA